MYVTLTFVPLLFMYPDCTFTRTSLLPWVFCVSLIFNTHTYFAFGLKLWFDRYIVEN